MKWVRGVGAILLAYVVSQGLNAGWVYFWYFSGRSLGTVFLFGATLFFLATAGIVSGYAAGKLSSPHGKSVGLVAAVLIAAVTVGNMVADVAAEPLWHKLIVLVVMAPLLAVAAARTGSTGETAVGRDAREPV